MINSNSTVNDSSDNLTSRRARRKTVYYKEKVWKINNLMTSKKVDLEAHHNEAVGNNKDYQNLIVVNRKRG